jgi:hypothetical protein
MSKSRKAAEVPSETQQPADATTAVIEHAKATMNAEVVTEPSPFPPEQPASAETNHVAQVEKKPFPVVRGWHTRNKPPVQFRRLHDADLRIIVFKFVLPKDENDKERMPVDIKDILDAHKKYPETGDPTGLHFENNRKHGKVWVLPDDPAGRAIADKMAIALEKLAAKHDLQAEQAAASR